MNATNSVRLVFGKNEIRFSNLRHNETFCLPTNQLVILKKIGTQSYSDENGQPRKIGTGTSVISVERSEELAESVALTGT